MSDATDIMVARRVADEITRGARRIGRQAVEALAKGFIACDRQRAKLERMRRIYDAAMIFVAAGHARDSCCAAGDHDNCDARLAEMELRRVASLVKP